MSSPRPPYGSHPAGGMGSAPLRLGHLVPERRPVVVERPNPEYLALAPDDPARATTPEMVDFILQGYAFGARCPGVVKAELASLEQVYHATVLRSTEDGTTAGFVGAWHTFLRESIQALVPGMTPGEADVLAAVAPGQEGPGTDLLRYLGLWQQEAKDDADPQPPSEEPPTTAPSSLISPPSTALAPTSS